MSKTAKTPKLRFKGFTDAWEQCEFKDLYQKATKKNDFTYGPDKIISVANMYFKQDSYISKESYLLTYNIFDLGDIAFEGNKSKKFSYGRFVENTIGTGIVSHVFDVYSPKMNHYDLQFWKYAINNERVMKDILIRCTKSSTMMTTLVANDFLKEKIRIPVYNEQRKIGALLEILNTLITLHQRKLKKLKIVKKSLLEKMFPKNGEKIPELRFKGFTDAWEQCELKELCAIFTDGDWIESKDQCSKGIRLIQTGNIGINTFHNKKTTAKWISNESFRKLHCTEVFPGDILVSRLPEPAGRACIVPNLNTKMITAVDCTIIRTSASIEKYFLIQQLASDDYFKTVTLLLAGGTRQRISRSNLGCLQVAFPPNKLEQSKAGLLFSKLDTLITLHQRKLEKLKTIKKSLLEKMFV